MVITVVSFNSRMIAKLVQSVNDRSLSRYWKKTFRARDRIYGEGEHPDTNDKKPEPADTHADSLGL